MQYRRRASALAVACLAFAVAVFGSRRYRDAVLFGRPRAVVNEKAVILSGHLAVLGGEPEVCDGLNDFLPITFSFQVSAAADVVNLDAEAFEVTLLNITSMETATVTPNCASLAPNIEADERRTVLLLGDFSPDSDVGPVKVEVVGNVSLSMPNGEEESVTGLSISQKPRGEDNFFGYADGPIIIDSQFLAPADTAADENGCATAFPDTTNVLRLKTKSAVRERNLTDVDGTAPLSLLGSDASLERAESMFTVETEGVELLGVADVDMDNIADLCVAVSGAVPGKVLVHMNCDVTIDDESAIVFGPDGQECRPQSVIVVTMM